MIGGAALDPKFIRDACVVRSDDPLEQQIDVGTLGTNVIFFVVLKIEPPAVAMSDTSAEFGHSLAQDLCRTTGK